MTDDKNISISSFSEWHTRNVSCLDVLSGTFCSSPYLFSSLPGCYNISIKEALNQQKWVFIMVTWSDWSSEPVHERNTMMRNFVSCCFCVSRRKMQLCEYCLFQNSFTGGDRVTFEMRSYHHEWQWKWHCVIALETSENVLQHSSAQDRMFGTFKEAHTSATVTLLFIKDALKWHL